MTKQTTSFSSHAALGCCPAALPAVVPCDCPHGCVLLAAPPPPAEQCEANRLPVLEPRKVG